MIKKPKYFKDNLQRFFITYTSIALAVLTVLYLLIFLIAPYQSGRAKSMQAAATVKTLVENEFQKCANLVSEMAVLPETSALLHTGKSQSNLFQLYYSFEKQTKLQGVLFVFDSEKTIQVSSAKIEYGETVPRLNPMMQRIELNPNAMLSESAQIEIPYYKKSAYTFGQAVLENNNVIGYIMLCLSQESLLNLISVENNDFATLVDAHSNVIVATNTAPITQFNKLEKAVLNGAGQTIKLSLRSGTPAEVFVAKSKIAIQQVFCFTFNSVSSSKIIYAQFVFLILLILLLLIIVMYFIGRKATLSKTQAISALLEGMRHLESGDFTYRAVISTGDEFETLGNYLNKAIKEIDFQVTTNNELRETTKNAELKRLQAQFNPHLLFNILETLRYAVALDVDKAQRIIATLSNVLRYSIYHSDDIVTVQQDIEYLTHYLQLYKFRYEDKLTVNLKIEPEILQQNIPKLVLQPLIENALKYGYTDKGEIDILISGYQQEDDLVFEVIDDGGGIEPQHFEKLIANLNAPNMPAVHTGLYNLNKRLILNYGAEYALEFDNQFGVSFKVRLRLKKTNLALH